MAFLIVLLMFAAPCALSLFDQQRSAMTRKHTRKYSLSAIAASVGALILLIGAALRLGWPS
jgi:uncharacterized membrane protein YidH (DUF202 family)